jgi:hypothetical protein
MFSGYSRYEMKASVAEEYKIIVKGKRTCEYGEE